MKELLYPYLCTFLSLCTSELSTCPTDASNNTQPTYAIIIIRQSIRHCRWWSL